MRSLRRLPEFGHGVAVKRSLVCDFERHATRDEAAKRFSIEPPFCTAEFDFVLKPARQINSYHEVTKNDREHEE
jgi:hypothetical protein